MAAKVKLKNYALISGFLFPSLVLLGAFIVYPVISTIHLSFHSWNGVFGAPRNFVGLSNYASVLSDPDFWNAMLNVGYFLLGGFLILMPLSFGLGLLVTSPKIRARGFMKTAFFMPVMLSVTAVSLMWVYILNPSFGALNQSLRFVGLEALTRSWLTTPTLNVWSVVLVNTWMFAGYNMLIFAAGLVSIPTELYEAAELDGCTGFKKIRYISIPLTKEFFKVFSVLCVTGCLRVFDMVWAMTRGGPNRISETPATLLYNQAFTFRLFGSSSAIGVILLILGVIASLLLVKAFKER